MYSPFILLGACIAAYLAYRIQALRKISQHGRKKIRPMAGEDAIADASIVGITNPMFNFSRYLRSVKNNSCARWMTVAIRQTIKTDMGATCEIRLIHNLAPGEERRLGHADDAQEGKYRIYIGYEILWARYTPTPKWYAPKHKRHLSPAEMYDELMKRYNAELEKV